MSQVDIVNSFSYWKDILLFAKYNSFEDEIIYIIKDSINMISIDSNTYTNKIIKRKMKESLLKELEYSIGFINNEFDRYYFGLINQETVLNYIEQCMKNIIDFHYPVSISIDEICLYYIFKEKRYLYNYEDVIIAYEKINNISYSDKKLNINGDKNFIKISKKNKNATDQVNTIQIAVASMNMLEGKRIEDNDIRQEYNGNYSINVIRSIIKNAKNENAEMILFPELCLPYKYALEILRISRKYHISVIIGLNHFISNDRAYNLVLIRDDDIDYSFCKSKNFFPYREKVFFAENNLEYIQKEDSIYIIVDNGKYKYSIMTCYEATSINDRSLLCDEIEVLYMPVYNRDTEYFSNIISSFAIDASCFVVQANNSVYGDSRITGPYSHLIKDIVKIKGGNNCYFVIGTINLQEIYEQHIRNKELEDLIEYKLNGKVKNKELASKIKEIKDCQVKTLVGNINKRIEKRQNNKIK